MCGRGEADATSILVTQGFLEEAEETPKARDGETHAAQFS